MTGELPPRLLSLIRRLDEDTELSSERRRVECAARRPVIQLAPDFMRRIARAGGHARMARITAEQRTQFQRRATMARCLNQWWTLNQRIIGKVCLILFNQACSVGRLPPIPRTPQSRSARKCKRPSPLRRPPSIWSPDPRIKSSLKLGVRARTKSRPGEFCLSGPPFCKTLFYH